jgi:hypothetical protein
MLGGVNPGNAGYGLYGGFGEGRVWADAASGMLKTPSTAARPTVANFEMCRRILDPPRF